MSKRHSSASLRQLHTDSNHQHVIDIKYSDCRICGYLYKDMLANAISASLCGMCWNHMLCGLCTVCAATQLPKHQHSTCCYIWPSCTTYKNASKHCKCIPYCLDPYMHQSKTTQKKLSKLPKTTLGLAWETFDIANAAGAGIKFTGSNTKVASHRNSLYNARLLSLLGTC